MALAFDPGYGKEPFRTLCQGYPGADVYPAADFRVEWGPVFHRGRLDGSARVLVIGQDPGQHEAIARRILVGEAGQRAQGLLAKLGIESSYVMINAFLYSVYGQGGGNRHKNDPAITQYRHQWLDALLVKRRVEAVIALGSLADGAFKQWRQTASGQKFKGAYQALIHPTYPESSSRGDASKRAAAMQKMLTGWNAALQALSPAIKHPDVQRPLALYGTALKDTDLAVIPAADLPAGLPEWMRSLDTWAEREGNTAPLKRATIVVTVPKAFRP